MRSQILNLPSDTVAPLLLGMKLSVKTPEGIIAGFIVETESYDSKDPASHTFKGPNIRNRSMFMQPGTLYVYLSYGLHNCLNIVCGKSDGQAVLIRSIEPVAGIDIMQQRRRQTDLIKLTNGPAKLTQALAITLSDDGIQIGHKVMLTSGFEPDKITQTTRVGITKAVNDQRRYYVTDNPYVSVR